MMAKGMIFDNSESDSEAESDNQTESENEKSLSLADEITTEMNNEVQEIDGSSLIAMMLDNSESDSEVESDNEIESDNEKSLSLVDEITAEGMEQVSENTDNESFDVASTLCQSSLQQMLMKRQILAFL